jgi:hypothetical protein
LTDIHILSPRPGVEEYGNNELTVADVRKIFKACPNVYQGGVGRENVWERHTPCNWSEDEDEDPQVHLLEKHVPEFYCAGSGCYLGDGMADGWRSASVLRERDLFLDVLNINLIYRVPVFLVQLALVTLKFLVFEPP